MNEEILMCPLWRIVASVLDFSLICHQYQNYFFFAFSIFDCSVSSAGVDQGPSNSEDTLIAVFFVVYIVIAPFFFLNVFIAMITVAFQSEDINKKKRSGLTERQARFKTHIYYFTNEIKGILYTV